MEGVYYKLCSYVVFYGKCKMNFSLREQLSRERGHCAESSKDAKTLDGNVFSQEMQVLVERGA